MASQAQVSDWITKTRRMYAQALDLLNDYQRLALEARLTGRAVVAADGVETNLTPDNFLGENAEIDPQMFVAAFAELGAVFAGASEDLATKLYMVR
jgi:hypothetical protein